MGLTLYIGERSFDITHNLGKMAIEANIYRPLWRPDEIGIKKATDLVAALSVGLDDMLSRPDFFKKFDSPNGWGRYDDFVPWVRRVLVYCQENPRADVAAYL